MMIKRMDHVGIVVDDLEAATAFFAELGMELVGKGRPRDVGWTAWSGWTGSGSRSHSCGTRTATARSS
jgi:catechol 2,3-dioxygenase-like lactoylglutathione lyase family enzyme